MKNIFTIFALFCPFMGYGLENTRSCEMLFVDVPQLNLQVAKHETTQRQWIEVMGTKPWSWIIELLNDFSDVVSAVPQEGDDYPAFFISYADAKCFCEILSSNDVRYAYRLPTENEFVELIRLSCPNGFTNIEEVACVNQRDPFGFLPVGRKNSSCLGLYDLIGNVAEWTTSSDQSNVATLRGCAFDSSLLDSPLSWSASYSVTTALWRSGFRCVRTPNYGEGRMYPNCFVSHRTIANNAAPSPPDLCVVLVDSLRPDHLGCYGCERDTSPAVDAFAAGAVRFDQAIASGSWTQPSIMSMMTSVPADIHQRVHWGRPHSTNVVTLAETLQKAGYQTVGLVANPMTNRKYGFARGFDFYDDWSLTGAPDATQGDIARQTAQGAKLTRLAKDWIEKRRDPEKPLFLFVLYIDVHWDYLPPPPFNRMFAPDPVPPPRDIWNLGRKSVPEAARRRSVAAYDGEIRYTDGCVSNLLAAIDASPRGKDTVVVFCSDHGESFWERGLASHGNALFDEELRVPLVIRPARGDGDPAPGRVVSEQVGLIDLAPTLADLVGVPAPTNWVGRSLAPALRGETLPEVPIVLDNRIGDDGAILRGVRTSRWKVLAGPPHDRPTSLYDLLADPAETNNLLRAGGFALPPEVEALVPLLKPVR